MKKIVSIIFTLFVLATNVNAQVTSFDYDNYFKKISGLGATSKSFTSSDGAVNLTVSFPEKYKGLNRNDPYMFLKTRSGFDCTVNIKIDLTSSDDDLVITKIVFRCENPVLLANSSISCNNSYDMSESVDGYDYILTNNFNNVKSVLLSKNLTAEVRVASIEVSYAKINSEVVLSDAVPYPYIGQYVNVKKVSYSRNIGTSKWGTLCLPFDYKIDDSKFTAYSVLRRVDKGESSDITLSKYSNGSTIKAGVPVIFYCSGSQLKVSATNALLTTESYTNGVSEIDRSTVNGYSFTIYGTIETKTMDHGFYIAQNKLYETEGKEITIKPYRAWLSPFDKASAAKLRTLVLDYNIFDDNETTSIEEEQISEESQVIYNSKGQIIPELQKGLNIIKTANGVKKVYVK